MEKRRTRMEEALSCAERAVASALRRDRTLRRFLLALAESVSGAGGTAFLAGGFLRAIAEGKPGGDVDVMVAGLSHTELGKTLRSLPFTSLGIRKVVPAGKHFPVYRVATVWRGYVDVSVARGPGKVRQGDPLARALADASRRDFTINSMLYALLPRGNRLAGTLLDPFGGICDLTNRTIGCVGKAEDRLREDPLRALRAIRMKCERKGYGIAPATFRAVKRLGPILLSGVAGERLSGELLRSFAADPADTFDDLRRSGILRILLPELFRCRGAVPRTARRCRFLARSSRAPLPPVILLANLLADLPAGDAEAVSRRLRFPDVRKVVRAISDIRALRRPDALPYPRAQTEAILRRQVDPGPFLALYRAAAVSDGYRGKDLMRFLTFCTKVPLLLDGSDLMEAGIPEAPGRQRALLAVREATLAGKIRTRKEALRFLMSIS